MYGRVEQGRKGYKDELLMLTKMTNPYLLILVTSCFGLNTHIWMKRFKC